jgi:hypothetical protein
VVNKEEEKQKGKKQANLIPIYTYVQNPLHLLNAYSNQQYKYPTQMHQYPMLNPFPNYFINQNITNNNIFLNQCYYPIKRQRKEEDKNN